MCTNYRGVQLILVAQALTMEGYASMTARFHELPRPLSRVAGLVPQMLGLDAAVDGSWLVFRSVDLTQRVAATWDLLFDPASVCFFIGGAVLLSLSAWRPDAVRPNWAAWFRSLMCLCVPRANRISGDISVGWLDEWQDDSGNYKTYICLGILGSLFYIL